MTLITLSKLLAAWMIPGLRLCLFESLAAFCGRCATLRLISSASIRLPINKNFANDGHERAPFNVIDAEV
jgi:hypothetical protein